MADPVLGFVRSAWRGLTEAWQRVRSESDDQLVRAVGRTAGRFDGAGEHVAALSAQAAEQVTRLSYTAARRVSDEAGRLADHLAARVERHGHELGDRVVHFGENFDRTDDARDSQTARSASRPESR